MAWTLDLAAEIESDMSAIHRIDDVAALDASRYYRLAELLPSYDGAVRRRFEVILRESEPVITATPSGTGSARPAGGIRALAAKSGTGRFPGIEYRG